MEINQKALNYPYSHPPRVRRKKSCRTKQSGNSKGEKKRKIARERKREKTEREREGSLTVLTRQIEAPDGKRRRLALYYGHAAHQFLLLLRFPRLSLLSVHVVRGFYGLVAVAMAEPLDLLPFPPDPGRTVRETRRLLRRLALWTAVITTFGRVPRLLLGGQAKFVQA